MAFFGQHVHQYENARLPSPGAQSWVFKRQYADPIMTIYGRSIQAGTFRTFGSPPLRANLILTTAGIGGIIAGQYALVGVTNPNNETGSI